MFENKSLPRVVRVKSTVPVKDDLEAFDFLSRFLAAEKAKQLSHDFVGKAYVASSSQIWNDLRLACNSLLEHNDSRREPVAAWKDPSAGIADESAMTENDDLKEENSEAKAPLTAGAKNPATPMQQSSASDEDSGSLSKAKSKEEKRSKKKEKKEAKKAAKKAKKSAKKEKKKRKRGEVDT